MFFTAVGIATCIAVCLGLFVFAYRGYETWKHLDGSAVGFLIRIVVPAIAAIIATYLLYSYVPLRIVAG
jgi:hypothetical protein